MKGYPDLLDLQEGVGLEVILLESLAALLEAAGVATTPNTSINFRTFAEATVTISD